MKVKKQQLLINVILDNPKLYPRVKFFGTGQQNVAIYNGYATHCSIGPRGGHYVHIVTDNLRLITRSVSSVIYTDLRKYNE